MDARESLLVTLTARALVETVRQRGSRRKPMSCRRRRGGHGRVVILIGNVRQPSP